MPSLQNKELKMKLIEDGTFDEFLKEKEALHKLGIEDLFDADYYIGWNEEELKACFQLAHMRYTRRTRINKWFDFWLKDKTKQLFFLTFTFNKKAMCDSFRNRQQYVYRNIKDFDDYIVNVDYGDHTNREHFHAVVVMDPEAEEFMNWKYSKRKKRWYCNDCELFNDKKGEVDIEKVMGDPIKLKKYQAKLTSHAMKNNCTKLGFKRNSVYQSYTKYMKETNKLLKGKSYLKRHSSTPAC